MYQSEIFIQLHIGHELGVEIQIHVQDIWYQQTNDSLLDDNFSQAERRDVLSYQSLMVN